MAQKDNLYPDLYFTREQLMLSAEETVDVANWIFKRSPEVRGITDRDRAFIQRALLIAIEKSEQAGLLFDVFSSFVSSAPKQSIVELVRNLAKRAARRWFRNYIDDTPKISAAGAAGLQYSWMATEWRLRVGTGNADDITGYLVN